MQRTLAGIENEKKEVERSAVRLEKDKFALKKTLDKVEREKMKGEEIMSRTVAQKSSLDQSIGRLEEDNVELQRSLQQIQAQLAQAEQSHSQRLIDLTTRHRQETEMETERLRSAQIQAERMLEARERAHRQRVKGLEEQIATLKDQLTQEMHKRQQFITRGIRSAEEVKDLRNILDIRSQDPALDPVLYEHESKKLDDTDFRSSPKKVMPRVHHRSPTRTSGSPTRLGRVTSTPPVGSGRASYLHRSARSPIRSNLRK